MREKEAQSGQISLEKRRKFTMRKGSMKNLIAGALRHWFAPGISAAC
jgi:hypothetical protein